MAKNKLILTLAVLMGISTSVLAAPVDKGNFEDVAKNHWAYGAISQLAKDGIIKGYSDNKFHGDKLMTRYEMAQIVQKALDNAGHASDTDKNLLESLCVEFQAELDSQEKRIQRLEEHNLTTHVDFSIRYVNDRYNGVMRPNENQNLYLNMINDYKLNDTWTAHLQSEVKYYWGNRLGYNFANDPWGGVASDPAGGGEYGNNRSGTVDKELFERLWLKGKVKDVDVTVGRKWDEFGTGLVWANEATGLWLGFGNNHTTLFVAQGNDTNTNKMDGLTQGDRYFNAYGMHTYRQFNDKVRMDVVLGGNKGEYEDIAGDSSGPRKLACTKWGELSTDVKLNDDLRLIGGITKTNADEYNSSYIVGLKYKDINLKKPGTFSISVKNVKIARNGASGGDIQGGKNQGGWAGLGLSSGGTWQNDWGLYDIGSAMWRQTSDLKAWVMGVNYVFDKDADLEVVYSSQKLQQPLQVNKQINRDYFRTAVNFHF